VAQYIIKTRVARKTTVEYMAWVEVAGALVERKDRYKKAGLGGYISSTLERS
jgi:hypothetical protein